MTCLVFKYKHEKWIEIELIIAIIHKKLNVDTQIFWLCNRTIY